MTVLNIADLSGYFGATRLCVALWVVISSTEWLAARTVFLENGLVPYRLMRVRRGFAYKTKLLQALYSPDAVRFVLAIRLAAGVLLLATETPLILLCITALIFAASVYISARAEVGGDGSDQMGLLITLGFLMMSAAIALNDSGVFFAAVLLLAGQAVLAYLVSGASKLISPIWRSGAAVVGVMNTQTYGHDFAISLMSNRPRLALAFCWLVIATEVLFPVILLLPPSGVVVGLSLAAAFHVSNAYFMGLNTFVPTFIGTYPSVVLLNRLIADAM